MVCLNHWKHLINSCCTDYHIKRHKQIGTPEFCFQSSVYTCICTISSIIRLNQWSFIPKTMKYLIDLNIQMGCFFNVCSKSDYFFFQTHKTKNVIQHTLYFYQSKKCDISQCHINFDHEFLYLHWCQLPCQFVWN